MKRRELLGLAAMVAIAGCSSDQEGGDPNGGDEPEGNGTEDTEDDVEDQDETDENEAESADDGPEDTNEDGEDEKDGDEKETKDDEESEPEPTDEELAAEHIDEATTAFEDAIVKFWEQSDVEDPTTPPLDASIEFDPISTEDQLSVVRQEVNEARNYEMTADQDDTLEALEAGDEYLRNFIDVHAELHDCYARVEQLLDDLENHDDSTAADDGSRLERDLQSLEDDVANLSDAAGVEWSTISQVAIMRGGALEKNAGVFGDDIETMQLLAAALPDLIDVHVTFWDEYDAYYSRNGEADAETVEETAHAFHDVDDQFEGSDAGTLSEYIEPLNCYAERMGLGAIEFIDAVESGDVSDMRPVYDYIDEAEECTGDLLELTDRRRG